MESSGVPHSFVSVAVVQVGSVGMGVRQRLVLVRVGMNAIDLGEIHWMNMVLMRIWVCMCVSMLQRLMNMVMSMIFAQHQPCARNHHRC